jgi:hypothetical protein
MSTPRTPCHGESASFDSTDQKDHAFAKSLCLGLRRPDGSQITKPCPMLGPCKKLLDDTLEAYGKDSVSGTWAGVLVVPGGHRRAVEEATYTQEQARRAKAAYDKGVRTPWVVAGHRTYRRRLAQKRAAEAA